MNEDLIDNTITNLKIIALCPKNSRLCVRKNQLMIETDDYLQSARRWFYRDSRDLTLFHIKNTISNAITLIKSLNNKDFSLDLKDWTLTTLLQELLNAKEGLINLKETYNDDSVFKANIDIIIERLLAYYETLNKNTIALNKNEKK